MDADVRVKSIEFKTLCNPYLSWVQVTLTNGATSPIIEQTYSIGNNYKYTQTFNLSEMRPIRKVKANSDSWGSYR